MKINPIAFNHSISRLSASQIHHSPAINSNGSTEAATKGKRKTSASARSKKKSKNAMKNNNALNTLGLNIDEYI